MRESDFASLRLSRRGALQLTGAGILALVTGTCAPADFVSEPFQNITELKRPLVLGTTVSRLQCEYLGLDYVTTLQKALDFGFDRLRIASYWKHHEPEENEYDFRELNQVYTLIAATNEKRKLIGQKPILVTQTVGTSQPRFPEFHFPPYIVRRYGMELWEGNKIVDSRDFLAQRNLKQIEAVVQIASEQDFVTDIQTENEPLNGLASAYGLRLSLPHLLAALQVVRANKRDDQQISLNFPVYLSPARTTEDEQLIETGMAYADIIGLDVYVKVPNNSGAFDRASELFWAKTERIKRKVTSAGKVLRISELQCEPWEKQMQAVILDLFENFISSNPKESKKLVTLMTEKGFNQIDVWGFEWWEYLAKMGYPDWQQEMAQVARLAA